MLFSSRRYFISSLNLFGSHADESVDFSFAIVLIINNCSIIKYLKDVISVFDTHIFSSRKIILPSSTIFTLSGTNIYLFFTDGVSQFTRSGSDSSVALGRMGALTK